MLKKLYEFLKENEKSLKDLSCYNDYYGIINEWNIAEEDEHLVKGNKFWIDGPDHELSYMIYKLAFDMLPELERHFNDNRDRVTKYYDSINEHNNKYEESNN